MYITHFYLATVILYVIVNILVLVSTILRSPHVNWENVNCEGPVILFIAISGFPVIG